MKWRLLMGAVTVAALGWAGWWVVGSSAQEAAIEGWLAERREAGWTARAASVETAGFPNRFDTRLEDVHLSAADGSWSWSAPFVDLMMLSYKPNHAVFAFPPEQSVSVLGQEAALETTRMLGSVSVSPTPSLPLERASTEIEAARLVGEGWSAGVGRAEAHLRDAGGTEEGAAYDLHAELLELRPPEEALRRVGVAGALPPVVDRVSLSGQVTLDRALDRVAPAEPPALRAISLDSAELGWGQISVRASGKVRVDEMGLAEGELAIRASEWRSALRRAVEAGALKEEVADLVEAALFVISGFGGDSDAVEAPLRFMDGRTWLGPIALGPAPRLSPARGS